MGLFEQVGLYTNTTKTEAMICTPGKTRTRLSAMSYYRSYQGYDTAKDWLSRRVECDRRGLDLAAWSLPKHIETKHGVYCIKVVEEEYLTPPLGGAHGTARPSGRTGSLLTALSPAVAARRQHHGACPGTSTCATHSIR